MKTIQTPQTPAQLYWLYAVADIADEVLRKNFKESILSFIELHVLEKVYPPDQIIYSLFSELLDSAEPTICMHDIRMRMRWKTHRHENKNHRTEVFEAVNKTIPLLGDEILIFYRVDTKEMYTAKNPHGWPLELNTHVIIRGTIVAELSTT
jgi:hypothetical protein